MKQGTIPVGFKFQHGEKGECTVIARTKRTITITHKKGKTKVTYRQTDSYFSPSDF